MNAFIYTWLINFFFFFVCIQFVGVNKKKKMLYFNFYIYIDNLNVANIIQIFIVSTTVLLSIHP